MYAKIKNTTSRIRHSLGLASDWVPEVGLILGSGLGSVVDAIESARSVAYGDIEGFPVSGVSGHSGQFVAGTIGGKRVLVMQGRVHHYEGYSMDQVVLGVRAMAVWGIKTLIVTNAAGGINPDFRVGDLMLIEDQINLLPNPLLGPNIEELGPRFVDMTEPYSGRLRGVAEATAAELGIALRRGVYLASTGPTYETPAEYRFFGTIGADACGMSTVSEVIAARHAGVEVVGFSIITNVAQAQGVNNHAEVTAAAQGAASNLTLLIKRCLVKL